MQRIFCNEESETCIVYGELFHESDLLLFYCFVDQLDCVWMVWLDRIDLRCTLQLIALEEKQNSKFINTYFVVVNNLMYSVLYKNIDLKLRNKVHGPMHYKIGVTYVWTRVLCCNNTTV